LPSGYPFPSTPTANDKGKRVEGDLLVPEKIPAGYYPLLVGFERITNRERGIG
jgi:hypothetical protein